MADGVKCELHGVNLALTTPWDSFAALARDYLAPLRAENAGAPQIHVSLAWDSDLPPADMERLGRRVWVGERRLRLTEIRLVPGLQMDILWDQGTLHIQAAYRWPDRRSRWMLRFFEAARMRLYVSLIYYLIYFPLSWWLERERAWSLSHAAGLAQGDTGVVLHGLPGCGKSTFVWGALSRPNWSVLSDNLLFVGEGAIWACPEPLHVDARARQLGGSAPSGARVTGRAFSHQREDFEILSERRAQRAAPRQVLFLHRGNNGHITPLPAEAAFRRLWAGDMLAQEWSAYQESAASMSYLAPEVGDPARRRANLENLSRHPCYEVVIPEGQPAPEAVYTLIEQHPCSAR